MTQTTSPPTIVQTIATSTVNAFVNHYDKLLTSILGALVAAIGLWFTGYVNAKASPVSAPAPRIEYVNAIPAWLGPKMDACVSGVADIQARLPKGKKK